VTKLPRILPLVGVAVGGVLAINALAGASSLPDLVSGARAWAEQAAKPAKGDKAKAEAKTPGDKAADPNAPGPLPGTTNAATGEAADAAAAGLPPPSIAPKPVCAPTAAELAKEAGLSPAELQVLQNLGARRGQLDEREQQLSTQLALLQAAEAKVDAKMRALNGLKADVAALLSQADGREAAEVDRLVKVFEGMKPKDAAARMAILDDSVRLPIAAKMKERSLSAIVGQMPPLEAKKLTESLAKRFAAAQTLAQSAEAKASAAATTTPVAANPPPAQAEASPQPEKAAAAAKPKRTARRPSRKTAPANQQASASPPANASGGAPAAAAPAPAKTAAAAPAQPAASAPAAPAKAG
jgi:flagellar motility protein MotE (MotC chaperone)